MGDSPLREKTMRATVAALLIFSALAYSAVPEFSEDVEPLFEDELVQEQLPSEAAARPPVNGDGDGKHYMFQPVDRAEVKVPAQAGNERAYRKEADNQRNQKDASHGQAVTDDERAAGLEAAKKVMQEHRATEQKEADKHLVAEDMNKAAQLAAFYKKKVAYKAQEDLEVKKAQLEVKAQQQVTENFKKQLREAERVLRAKQSALVKEQSKDLQAKYKMEKAGEHYRRSKTEAIRADNAEKEREHKERLNKQYQKVAERAVTDFAKKTAAPKPKKKKAKKKAAPKKKKTACHNCVELPKEYSKMKNKHGEKGSCADCGDWAGQGYCTNDTYKAFMANYCAASCLSKTGKCGNNPQ